MLPHLCRMNIPKWQLDSWEGFVGLSSVNHLLIHPSIHLTNIEQLLCQTPWQLLGIPSQVKLGVWPPRAKRGIASPWWIAKQVSTDQTS